MFTKKYWKYTLEGLWHWFWCWVRLKPHELIWRRTGEDPYLLRWYVLPRIPLFNSICVYLHKFVDDDELEALHDHPRDSISFFLRGQYREYTPDGAVRIYRAGDVIRRSATFIHRVELIDKQPAWTLFIMGPKKREWGFWCPYGFKHWKPFHANLEQRKAGCSD